MVDVDNSTSVKLVLEITSDSWEAITPPNKQIIRRLIEDSDPRNPVRISNDESAISINRMGNQKLVIEVVLVPGADVKIYSFATDIAVQLASELGKRHRVAGFLKLV